MNTLQFTVIATFTMLAVLASGCASVPECSASGCAVGQKVCACGSGTVFTCCKASDECACGAGIVPGCKTPP